MPCNLRRGSPVLLVHVCTGVIGNCGLPVLELISIGESEPGQWQHAAGTQRGRRRTSFQGATGLGRARECFPFESTPPTRQRVARREMHVSRSTHLNPIPNPPPFPLHPAPPRLGHTFSTPPWWTTPPALWSSSLWPTPTRACSLACRWASTRRSPTRSTRCFLRNPTWLPVPFRVTLLIVRGEWGWESGMPHFW